MFLERLSPIESKIKILEEQLQDPNLIKNQKEYAKIIKEYNYLEKIKEKKMHMKTYYFKSMRIKKFCPKKKT